MIYILMIVGGSDSVRTMVLLDIIGILRIFPFVFIDIAIFSYPYSNEQDVLNHKST